MHCTLHTTQFFEGILDLFDLFAGASFLQATCCTTLPPRSTAIPAYTTAPPYNYASSLSPAQFPACLYFFQVHFSPATEVWDTSTVTNTLTSSSSLTSTSGTASWRRNRRSQFSWGGGPGVSPLAWVTSACQSADSAEDTTISTTSVSSSSS